MKHDDAKEGQLVIFDQYGDKCQIGKIKRITDSGAFVWYSEGETAAKTPFSCLKQIDNSFAIKRVALGSPAKKMSLHDMVSTLRMPDIVVEIRDEDNLIIGTFPVCSQGIEAYMAAEVVSWFPDAAPGCRCDFTVLINTKDMR